MTSPDTRDRMRFLPPGVIPGIVLLAALAALAGPAAAAVQVPDHFRDEIVVGGLDAPTSFAFLPDGRVLVAEQNTGRVRLVVGDHVAATDPALVVPNLQPFGERGLLGLAVDPRWPAQPYVYVMYTRTGGRETIVRFRGVGALHDSAGEALVFGSPLVLLDDIRDTYSIHNAGCLRFGPDGCLYASLGDDAFFCDAADSTTLRGAILRMRVDRLPAGGGSQVSRASLTPGDNPFVASPDRNARLVWAWGFRNPFRFQIDPVLGTLIVGDVGDQQFEEIDEVDRGDFMGWPWVEGRYPRTRPECPDDLGRGLVARGPLDVIAHDQPVGYAIISAGPYRFVYGASHNWPAEYDVARGDVFYGQYYEGYLRRLTWDGVDWLRAAPVTGQPNADDWATGLHASVDFLVGPDGSLWWLSQYDESYANLSGSLHRIVYAGGPTGVDPVSRDGNSLTAIPNPFRERVALTISLTSAARVSLGIYDVTGRRVRSIDLGWQTPGTTHVSWDGADEAGAPTGPGIYFVKLERGGARSLVTRVFRVR